MQRRSTDESRLTDFRSLTQSIDRGKVPDLVSCGIVPPERSILAPPPLLI